MRIAAAALGLFPLSASVLCADEPPAVRVIREEALKSNRDEGGRPLPLAAHWHRRTTPLSYQIEQMRDGHHLLPWIATPRRDWSAEKVEEEYGAGLMVIRKWRLPLALVTGGQWEADLYDHKKQWRLLPPAESPLVVPVQPVRREDGTIKPTLKQLSPFGAVQPWRQVGKTWTDNEAIRAVQNLYPDVPLLLFISNNEANDLRWHEVESKSKRYLDKYGKGRDGEFKRKVVAEGWIERYTAMFDAMRAGFVEDAWKKNTLFVAYSALGPNHLGRWSDWKNYSLTTADRLDPGPWMWDGAIPEYYDNHWQPQKSIWNVWSCQTEAMNMVLLKKEALKHNPEFWHEVIFWDGNLTNPKDKKTDRYKTYTDKGHPPSPERYRGWLQYGLWLLTPRVAREFRGSADPRERWEPYFNAIIAAVDLVHNDKVLTRFWRRGTLVPNRSQEHPFQTNVPAKWQKADRWFHLNTNLDPKEWSLKSEVPVYTLARVIGQKPHREWLLYAHAPKGDRRDVSVAIPDYKSVVVEVSLAGSFYYIREQDGEIQEVGK